jgi:hypothetical protein
MVIDMLKQFEEKYVFWITLPFLQFENILLLIASVYILAYKFGNNSKKWLGSSYKTPVQPLMKSQSLNHKSRPYYPEQTIAFYSCSKFCMISLRKKSKTVLLSPCRCQGEEEYSSYSFLTSALHGVSGQCHATAALYPQYPLDTRLGRPQSWSGHRGQGKNPLPLPYQVPNNISNIQLGADR